jgi:hypothetical protein
MKSLRYPLYLAILLHAIRRILRKASSVPRGSSALSAFHRTPSPHRLVLVVSYADRCLVYRLAGPYSLSQEQALSIMSRPGFPRYSSVPASTPVSIEARLFPDELTEGCHDYQYILDALSGSPALPHLKSFADSAIRFMDSQPKP